MRCPKCGYISFDREETCAKCDASLAEISRTLAGTAVRVEEPLFLASILGQAGQQEAAEEVEFDLSEAVPDAEVEIALAEDEIPVVDLSPFEQPAAAEEEAGISFAMPGGEEAVEEEGAAQLAGEEAESGMQGTIDFSFGGEGAQEELQPGAAPGLDLAMQEAGGEEALEELGGAALALEEESEAAALETEESLPELELEMGGEAGEALELEGGDQAEMEEEPPAGERAAAKGPGLDLDIDVDLEEGEPPEEEMVFNLEDIDMSDLVIDESGAKEEEAGRPEDTALDLEDFLSGGKGNDADAPMDLTMEDLDLGDEDPGKDKKAKDRPDLEL